MQIKIRKAQLSDAKKIAQVHVRTWKSAYKSQLSNQYLKSLKVKDKLGSWQSKLRTPSCYILVAEINEKLVGFCLINKNTGEISALYVLKSYSNKGIGTALMKKSISYLKKNNFKNTTLWVLKTNNIAKTFYEKNKWKSTNKTKIYYKNNEKIQDVLYTYKIV